MVAGLIVLLVCVGVVSAKSQTPSGDYVKTTPYVEYGDGLSEKGNYVKVEVYGYQLDPRKDEDPKYDYYIFLIWGTVDPNENWGGVEAHGADDPDGATMHVEFYAWDDTEILTRYIEPKDYTYSGDGKEVTFNLGIEKGGASASISWTQFIPRWEVKLRDANSEWVKWDAGVNTEKEYKQACIWGFGVGVRVPEGKSPRISAYVVGHFWNEIPFWPDEHDTYSVGLVGYIFQGLKPEPKIIKVDYPKEVEIGDWVTIEVRAKNEGGTPTGKGWIDISFPDNPKDVEIVSSSSPYITRGIKWPGDEIGCEYGKWPCIAEYPLAWVTVDFIAGEEYYLKVRAKPEKVGYFRFNVKVGSRDEDKYYFDPEVGSCVCPGEYCDKQQRECIYPYKVCVNGHWEPDPDNPCKERRLRCDGSYEYRNKPDCTYCGEEWVKTGETKWERVGDCSECKYKEEEYVKWEKWEKHCYNGYCKRYKVVDTEWRPTGNIRCVNKPDGTDCGKDGWYDTGKTRWITVNEYACKKQEKEQKEQQYRDYYCSGGSCTYRVTNTRWVDTGNTRWVNKPDGTDCCCNGNCDGWYDTGNTRWVTTKEYECKYDQKEQKEQQYRDYYCSGGSCTYRVTDTKWVDTGKTRTINKPDGTDCCLGGNCDGWYDTGKIRWVEDSQNPCYEKEQKEQQYKDYYCSGGSCTYKITDTRWIDTGNKREKVKEIEISTKSKTMHVGDKFQFKATATYANGTTGDVTYKAEWSSNNPSILRSDGDGWFTALSVGSATVTVEYYCKSDTATVTVENRNPSIELISPKNGESVSGNNVTLKWNGSDPDGDKLTYDLYFGITNPPPKFKTDLVSDSYEVPVMSGKTYYWKVVAKDNHGGKTESPIWSFTTEEIKKYGVDLSCDDPEKSIPSRGYAIYNITVKNTGNVKDIIDLTLPPPCYCGWVYSLDRYSVELLPGESTGVVLNVSDVLGHPAGSYWEVKVTGTSRGDPTKSDFVITNTTIKGNKPPIASFTYSPENPVVNQTIIFNASSSYDPDGTIVKYEWDFGDGSKAEGKVVTHSYSKAGDYTVTLTVTDDEGATNSTTKEITVPPPPEVTISFNPSKSIIGVGSTAEINLTLDKAQNGLSGYNITVSLSNATVAEITSVSFPDWATLHLNSTLPADSLWIKAGDLNDKIKSGATNITLATITLRGDKQGISDILITVTKMDDDNGDPINPNTVSGKVEVIGVIPFPGCENPPTDPDRDGLYEDINGNGRKDFNDVVVFFNYLEWVEENQPCIECFDFNKNGRIDFDDVVKLFEEI